MKDKKAIFKSTLRSIFILTATYLGYKLISPAFRMNDRPNIYKNATFVDNNVLAFAVDSLNKNSYVWLDSMTEFINAAVGLNKTLQLNFALKIDTNKYDIHAFKEATEKYLLDSILISPSFKRLRDNNVTVIYNFTDIKMNFLFNILFTPDKYKIEQLYHHFKPIIKK